VQAVKELRGSAMSPVAATPEQCLALLADVERYPSWYPEVVRRAQVVERRPDGVPARAQTTLHVAQGPFVRDFDLLLAVDTAADAVSLTRIPHDPNDAEQFAVRWQMHQSGDGVVLHLQLEANLSVPRLVPLGGIGNVIAGGFVGAAARALGG
jgi:ribosome-associated toxin RatA of RatAB toxin-antitoxin module